MSTFLRPWLEADDVCVGCGSEVGLTFVGDDPMCARCADVGGASDLPYGGAA